MAENVLSFDGSASYEVEEAGLRLLCQMFGYPIALAVISSKNKLARLPDDTAVVAPDKNARIAMQQLI